MGTVLKSDDSFDRNVLPSANQDGSTSTSGESGRASTYDSLKKYSKAKVIDITTATMLLKERADKLPRSDSDMEPNVSEAANNAAGTKQPPPSPSKAAPITKGRSRTAKVATQEEYVEQAPVAKHEPSKADKYLTSVRRVSFKTGEGTFLLPVIDIKRGADSILVMLPLKDDSTAFIPNRGAELTITWREDGRDRSEDVYFPSTYAEIPELSMIVLAFVVISK